MTDFWLWWNRPGWCSLYSCSACGDNSGSVPLLPPSSAWASDHIPIQSRPFCNLSCMTSFFLVEVTLLEKLPCDWCFWEAVEKNNPYHLCIVLSNPPSPHHSPYLILTTTRRIGYYYPHFTVQEAKAQRGKVMFPKVLCWLLSYCLSPPVCLYSTKLGLRLQTSFSLGQLVSYWVLPIGGAREIPEGRIREKRHAHFRFACCSCKWLGLRSQSVGILVTFMVWSSFGPTAAGIKRL